MGDCSGGEVGAVGEASAVEMPGLVALPDAEEIPVSKNENLVTLLSEGRTQLTK